MSDDRLIHWRTGVCERRDTNVDQEVHDLERCTVTYMGWAIHPENVTCPVCLENIRKEEP